MHDKKKMLRALSLTASDWCKKPYAENRPNSVMQVMQFKHKG
jgi:hypothetical protein